ncbi:cytosine permease [Nitriliruptor alkaliphilus]|uniref:cytosine permease n=1 Tax=Nitriliruptor alkaliphilus TaxID=427918 RepID=UPI000697D116|nr:cytosine permease [Nitriliruptor alkaliphilus]
MRKQRSFLREEMYFNLLPLRARDRLYGGWDFLAVQICFGIAAWFFLTGSLTGLTLPAREAIPVILVGNSLPLFLVAGLAAIFARYGVEHWQGTSAVFGHRLKDVWLIIYVTSSFGWIAYAAYLFGQSATKFLDSFGAAGTATAEGGAIGFAVVATVAGAFIAYLGPQALKWFTRGAALLLLVLLGVFTWVVLTRFGLTEILAAEPAEPMESVAWSRASAIEFNVGLGFSWAFWYGQWTRLSKTERGAFHGCLWGWGILAATAGVFSAFVALALGLYDPTDWIVTLGGGLAALGLLLFAIANLSSIAAVIYPLAITLRTRFPRLNWGVVIAICSLPAIVLENERVFANFGTYLAYIALLTGTYGGIMMGDYLLVSRGRHAWRLRDLYVEGPASRYWYMGGFNPAALIATVAGAAFYLWTLDPLHWTSANGWFPYITAGIPSFVLSFVLYAVIMRLWILPWRDGVEAADEEDLEELPLAPAP